MNLLSKFKRYSVNGWYVALRKRTELCLFEGNDAPFYIIPQGVRFWRADPFLFKYQGKNYLFVEEFDMLIKKGRISVAEVVNGRCQRFRPCIDIPYHLSYPCIYEYDTNIYMIPECYESGKVVRYKCKSFPYEWIEEKVLLEEAAADTTPIILEGNVAYITTIFKDSENRKNDNLWMLNYNNDDSLHQIYNNFYCRCAGHVIFNNVEENEFIRPSQDCSETYGAKLLFNKGIFQNGKFQEHVIGYVLPPSKDNIENSLNIYNFNKFKKTQFTGVHTYNVNEDYEVVDLKYNTKKNVVCMFNMICNLIFHRKG